MRQWFSYREPYISQLKSKLTPDGVLEESFNDLTFTYKLAFAPSRNDDGRLLGYIDASSQAILDTVVTGLSMFAVKKINITAAKVLADKLIGRAVSISGDNINIPKHPNDP